MARGVPQDEIHRVADELLASGERPTVERVRQALGRGSPNTIGPMLDAWWAQLAQRQRQRLTLLGVRSRIGPCRTFVRCPVDSCGRPRSRREGAWPVRSVHPFRCELVTLTSPCAR